MRPLQEELIMREIHERTYGPHYNEYFAKRDVSAFRYKGKQGAHFSMKRIKRAFASYNFPDGTTEWDKYVAANAMYAYLCDVLDDAKILEVTYHFFFCHDAYGREGKIWYYINEY